jgi:hypothetical protein
MLSAVIPLAQFALHGFPLHCVNNMHVIDAWHELRAE